MAELGRIHAEAQKNVLAETQETESTANGTNSDCKKSQ